jgi:hypothetical protein
LMVEGRGVWNVVTPAGNTALSANAQCRTADASAIDCQKRTEPTTHIRQYVRPAGGAYVPLCAGTLWWERVGLEGRE